MKKALIAFITTTLITLTAFADNKQEAVDFFNNYINAANTYSNSIGDMYSPNAKIIRQVVKPDGTLVNAYTDTATYVKQMKLSQATAKLRKYTNSYSDIKATKISENKYKISSLRQPKGETYKLKTYQILEKQPNGKWLIVEELMQTKEQIFLKFAPKS